MMSSDDVMNDSSVAVSVEHSTGMISTSKGASVSNAAGQSSIQLWFQPFIKQRNARPRVRTYNHGGRARGGVCALINARACA